MLILKKEWNKIMIFKYVLMVGFCCLIAQGGFCKEESQSDLNYVRECFSTIAGHMELESSISSNIIREISHRTVLIDPEFQMRDDELVVNTSKIYMRFDYKTKKLKNFNFKLIDAIKNNPTTVPSLSLNEAIDKAKIYLRNLGVELPDNASLKTVQFNVNHMHCWEIRWGPSYGKYDYDDFVTPYEQSIVVAFHETIGLYFFGKRYNFPAPKSTRVKVLKEDAIRRAEKVVPLVMKTPYYQMCRLTGFKVSGLDKAELLVSAPNWLLDPKRAVWVRKKIPEESRLCWVVTLLTVDAVTRKDGMKPIPPKIVVYVDAATGEIVGANFT
jgi:hypothetical protein